MDSDDDDLRGFFSSSPEEMFVCALTEWREIDKIFLSHLILYMLSDVCKIMRAFKNKVN